MTSRNSNRRSSIRRPAIRRIDIAVWLTALAWAAFGIFGPVA